MGYEKDLPSAVLGTRPSNKSVNADEYMPPSCDFDGLSDEPVYTFSNGWTLRDARTKHDQRLMARATLTCVGGMRLYDGPPLTPPTPEEVEVERERLTDEGRKMFFKKEGMPGFNEVFANERLGEHVESHLRRFKARNSKAGSIKLLYVCDDENRPRCCVYMALVKGLNREEGYDRVDYGSSRDLSQEHPVMVEGEEWHLVEARLGTGAHPPKVCEPLLVEWYENVTGKFDHDAYEKGKAKRQYYGAVGSATISASELQTIRALREG